MNFAKKVDERCEYLEKKYKKEKNKMLQKGKTGPVEISSVYREVNGLIDMYDTSKGKKSMTAVSEFKTMMEGKEPRDWATAGPKIVLKAIKKWLNTLYKLEQEPVGCFTHLNHGVNFTWTKVNY